MPEVVSPILDFPEVTLDSLKDVAEVLAEQTKGPTLILLHGDLGAGKTTFSRAFIRTLTHQEDLEVVSPTFTIMQTYDTPQGPLTHFDLYRIKSSDEIYELGLDDYLNHHICLIEWPERLDHLPPSRFDVYIGENPDGTRNITIHHS